MRLKIFDSPADYELFEELMIQAAAETGMRILAYCLMPNHWHLLLYPSKDGDVGLFMHRLTNAHTRQVHSRTGTIGSGPLYQGRYKSFIIQDDVHFLTVLKYVERNATRAYLAPSAEAWRWGSAWHRTRNPINLLAAPPVPLPDDYQIWINTPERSEELSEIRTSVTKSSPYGKPGWVDTMVKEFGLESTIRDKGRPRK